MIGSFMEDKAVCFLKNHGFTILRRNYHCKIGEIDIIAMKNHTLHFIEVKYRKTDVFGHPAEAVTTTKKRKIYFTAQWFLTENNQLDKWMCSFDVIAIAGEQIQYYDNCYGAM